MRPLDARLGRDAGRLLAASGTSDVIDAALIALMEDGDEVFKAGMSLIWKKLVVTRIYDKPNDTLIYLAHSRELTDGSAKMSISTIPLYGQNPVWKNGKPQ